MPTKPKRPCSYPGCPRLTAGRFCEKHAKQEARRCIMPDVLAFYKSEEGQREFAEWKERREFVSVKENQ